MVIPLMVCGLILFAVVFSGIYQLQRHQMRWTRSSIEQRQAYFLADSAMNRGIARYVAQHYSARWYGDNPVDDQLADRKHAGLFDRTSEAADDGPPAPTTAGTYTLLAEDRHAGELEGDPLIPDTTLGFTELFAHATVPGFDGPVRVLVYGRLAICPGIGYLTPDPAAPERMKKVLRYRVYTEPDLADRDYQTPGTDTAAARSRFHWEIARAHQNFLRNRLAFRDLRAKVDAAWNRPAAGVISYTDAQAEALFAGIAPINLNANEQTDPAAVNWFSVEMFRKFRLSDLALNLPEGMRFVVDPASLYDARKEAIAASVMRLFAGRTLEPLPDWTKVGSVSPFDSGDKFMDREIRPGVTAESIVDQPLADWTYEVANHWRDEQVARILPGHVFPYPTPTGPFSDPEAGTKYADSAYLDLFAAGAPPTIDEMKTEVVRINPLIPPDKERDPNALVQDLGIKRVAYPILLYAQLVDEGGRLQDNPTPVTELITYFGKYIEAPQAPFVADGPPNPGPAIPPEDPSPPKENPDLIPATPTTAPNPPGGYVSGLVVP